MVARAHAGQGAWHQGGGKSRQARSRRARDGRPAERTCCARHAPLASAAASSRRCPQLSASHARCSVISIGCTGAQGDQRREGKHA